MSPLDLLVRDHGQDTNTTVLLVIPAPILGYSSTPLARSIAQFMTDGVSTRPFKPPLTMTSSDWTVNLELRTW